MAEGPGTLTLKMIKIPPFILRYDYWPPKSKSFSIQYIFPDPSPIQLKIKALTLCRINENYRLPPEETENIPTPHPKKKEVPPSGCCDTFPWPQQKDLIDV